MNQNKHCTLKSSDIAAVMSHFLSFCMQTGQWKRSRRATELSAKQTEATVLTVNTHTVCLLSTWDDRRITYTHTHTLIKPVPLQYLMSYPRAGNSANTWATHTDTLTGQGASVCVLDRDKDITGWFHAGVSNKAGLWYSHTSSCSASGHFHIFAYFMCVISPFTCEQIFTLVPLCLSMYKDINKYPYSL